MEGTASVRHNQQTPQELQGVSPTSSIPLQMAGALEIPRYIKSTLEILELLILDFGAGRTVGFAPMRA
ncbi:MAG: hypothetical protein KF726_05145 [Anaerolineae bacterium]|nr:hypothetical protein [Anaerolineae bacterium]